MLARALAHAAVAGWLFLSLTAETPAKPDSTMAPQSQKPAKGQKPPKKEQLSKTRMVAVWDPSGSGLDSVPKPQVEGTLLTILQACDNCYAYVVSGGDPRPGTPTKGEFVALPILLTSEESSQEPDWADWNRLGATIAFFPQTQGPSMRSFFSVQLFSNREAYLSYVPDAENKYNLRHPPMSRVLTRPQMVRHWNNLPRHRVGPIERDRIVWLLFGFSPPGFDLGDTSSNKTAADKVAYFLGSAYLLNPYGAITAGWMTDDGKRFRPGFGVNLDLGILTAIFK